MSAKYLLTQLTTWCILKSQRTTTTEVRNMKLYIIDWMSKDGFDYGYRKIDAESVNEAVEIFNKTQPDAKVLGVFERVEFKEA